MINLIPTDHKTSITYARRNSKITGWLIGAIIAISGLAIIAGGGLFYINQDIARNEASIKETQSALTAENEKETLTRVEEIGGRLSLVVNVLSRELLFSKLLPYLGALMPEGAIFENFSLARDQIGGIDLTIGAIDEFAASQALANIKDPENLLFSEADANQITCENKNTIYVCTASIRAILIEKNPFLLLSQGASDD